MCDDGNRDAEDGCSPSCYFEADSDGGAGDVQPAPELQATADGHGCAHGRPERSPLGSVVLAAAAFVVLARRRRGS